MNKFSQRFATIHGDIIVSVTEAYPAHELLPNQFEVTADEFKLIQAIKSISLARKLIKSLEKKIKDLKND